MPDRDPNKIKRRTGSAPLKQTLREITAKVPPVEGRLDLIHVTSAGFASGILEAGKVEVRFCKEFQKPLVYLFVCQAAYRRSDWDEKSDNSSIFPAAFIIDPTKLSFPPYHVYPFDTGAALQGRYTNAAADGVFLEDYALEQSLDHIKRFIRWAFGTLDKYKDQELLDHDSLRKTYKSFHHAVDRYIHIVRQSSRSQNQFPDQRAASIEVAYDQHLPLKAVRCAIIPDVLIEDPYDRSPNTSLVGILSKHKIQYRLYSWRANDTPESHMQELERLCREEMEKDYE